jgi:hypothetical protein
MNLQFLVRQRGRLPEKSPLACADAWKEAHVLCSAIYPGAHIFRVRPPHSGHSLSQPCRGSLCTSSGHSLSTTARMSSENDRDLPNLRHILVPAPTRKIR